MSSQRDTVSFPRVTLDRIEVQTSVIKGGYRLLTSYFAFFLRHNIYYFVRIHR